MNEQKLRAVLHALASRGANMFAPSTIHEDIDAAFPPATPPATTGTSRPAACADCGLDYRDDGWAETIIPDELWAKIEPENGSLLCFTCINRRLNRMNLRNVPFQITSGPFNFMIRDVTGATREAFAPPPGSSPQEGEGPIGLVQRPDGRWDIMRGDYECYSIKYGDWVGIGTSTPHSNGAIMDERVAAAVAAVLRSNGKENGTCGGSSQGSPGPSSSDSSPELPRSSSSTATPTCTATASTPSTCGADAPSPLPAATEGGKVQGLCYPFSVRTCANPACPCRAQKAEVDAEIERHRAKPGDSPSFASPPPPATGSREALKCGAKLHSNSPYGLWWISHGNLSLLNNGAGWGIGTMSVVGFNSAEAALAALASAPPPPTGTGDTETCGSSQGSASAGPSPSPSQASTATPDSAPDATGASDAEDRAAAHRLFDIAYNGDSALVEDEALIELQVSVLLGNERGKRRKE